MSLKKDFPIFANHPGMTYLDSAASLQKPQSVIDGVKDYLQQSYANIHRGQYRLSEISELLYRQSRKKVAELIGAKDEEVVFTASATDSVNKLVQSLIHSGRLRSGDTVLLSELEHHANIVGWQIAAKHHGIKLSFVGLDDTHQIDITNFAQCLDATVKVVSLTMVSNVTGGITNLQKVNALLDNQAVRPLFFLDASQAVPHFNIDVTTLGADALFFTGHKLGALTGIGVLWGRSSFLKELSPAYGGGGMVEEVTTTGFTLQAAPDKFEPGTPNLVGAISMKLTIEYMEAVAASYKPQATSAIAGFYEYLNDIEQPLIEYCLEQFTLLEKQDLQLLGPRKPTERIGVFAFTLPTGKNTTQLGQRMAEKDICIRCGAQCAHIFHAGLEDQTGGRSCIQNTCRMSLRGYNDIGDVKQFFDRLTIFLDR